MKTEAFKQIVKANEDTNVFTVLSMDQAFGKPLNAGALVVFIDEDTSANSFIAVLNTDNGASKCLNTTDYYATEIGD